jgi:hypothetical protein
LVPELRGIHSQLVPEVRGIDTGTSRYLQVSTTGTSRYLSQKLPEVRGIDTGTSRYLSQKRRPRRALCAWPDDDHHIFLKAFKTLMIIISKEELPKKDQPPRLEIRDHPAALRQGAPRHPQPPHHAQV